MKVLVIRLCLTLYNPLDCSPPGSSVHGILQARILKWVTIPFSRGSSDPGIEPRSPILQADSLPSEPPGETQGPHEWDVMPGKQEGEESRWESCSHALSAPWFYAIDSACVCALGGGPPMLKGTQLLLLVLGFEPVSARHWGR